LDYYNSNNQYDYNKSDNRNEVILNQHVPLLKDRFKVINVLRRNQKSGLVCSLKDKFLEENFVYEDDFYIITHKDGSRTVVYNLPNWF